MTKVQKLLTSAHVQRRKFQEFEKKNHVFLAWSVNSNIIFDENAAVCSDVQFSSIRRI